MTAGRGVADGSEPVGPAVARAVAAAGFAVTVTVAAGRAAAGAVKDEQPVSAVSVARVRPAVLASAMRFMSQIPSVRRTVAVVTAVGVAATRPANNFSCIGSRSPNRASDLRI